MDIRETIFLVESLFMLDEAIGLKNLIKTYGAKVAARFAIERDQAPPEVVADIDAQPGENDGEKVIAYLMTMDPNPRQTYTVWLVNRYLHGDFYIEDAARIREELAVFDRVKQRLANKDILKYSAADLYDAIQPFLKNEAPKTARSEEQELARRMHQPDQAKILYNDADLKVLVPLTKEASCYFGRSTKWCTAATNSQNYYHHYAKQGDLIVILFKKENRRYQYHYESNQFKDERDVEIDRGALLRAHPILLKIIGEDKFIRDLAQIGPDLFDPEALAKLQILDRDGIRAWRTRSWQQGKEATSTIVAQVGEGQFLQGTLVNGKIAELSGDGLRHQPGATAHFLNLLGVEPTDEFARRLASSFVYYQNGRYGSPKDVGEKVYELDIFTVYRVKNAVFVMSADREGKDHVSLRLNVEGSTITHLDYDDARLDDAMVADILNHLGLMVSETVEENLSGFHLFTTGKRFGPLDKVGVKETTLSDGKPLYRLGKRRQWVVGDQRGRNAVWLKGTTNGHLRVRLGYDRIAGEAIRFLVKKHGIKQVEDAVRYGVLNTENGAVADLDGFIALTGKPAFVKLNQWLMNEENLSFLRQHREAVTPQQVARIVAAFRPDATEPNWFQQTDVSHVFDLTIPEFTVHLPVANALICEALGVPMSKTVVNDLLKAIRRATAAVEAHTVGRFQMSGLAKTVWSHGGEGPLDEGFAALDAAMTALRRATNRQVEDRRANPEQYATDLSSRFAALNAFRKMR